MGRTKMDDARTVVVSTRFTNEEIERMKQVGFGRSLSDVIRQCALKGVLEKEENISSTSQVLRHLENISQNIDRLQFNKAQPTQPEKTGYQDATKRQEAKRQLAELRDFLIEELKSATANIRVISQSAGEMTGYLMTIKEAFGIKTNTKPYRTPIPGNDTEVTGKIIDAKQIMRTEIKSLGEKITSTLLSVATVESDLGEVKKHLIGQKKIAKPQNSQKSTN